MRRIGLGTLISIGLNLFLIFWLVNTYQDNVYFQAYVNLTISQIYPFIVLTIGVGGGSGLGYLLLRKRHSDQGIAGRIQKIKPFKPTSPLASSSTSGLSQGKNLPAGAPPTPASRHTAYAVPPLPKSSTPSTSRTIPATTWSTGTQLPSAGSFPGQKQEPALKTTPSPSLSRPETPQLSTGPRVTSETPGKPGAPPLWKPEQATGDRNLGSGPTFPKPGLELVPRAEPSILGPPSGIQPQGPQQQSPVPGSKWQPPGPTPSPGQWPENAPKPSSPVPPKWAPSPPVSGPQGQPRPPAGLPPRPGPFPLRPPLPQSQGGPRPFVIQGPGRPGEPGPVAMPRPFRPDMNRPPPGMGPQSRPPQPMPRPAAPLGGSMPQPWTPPQPLEKKETASPAPPQKSSAGSEQAMKPGSDQKSPEGAGGGEMDWDTALDTILKTLRKDRVGERQ